MRRVTVVTMALMMCMTMMMASGCGKEKKAEVEEATEPVSEISITTDAVEETPTEAVEAEIEEYDFSVTEDTGEENETVSEDIVAETDEFGVTTIDEITLYATDTVRMRKEPNTDSEVAGMLSAGEEVIATGKSEEWHRIKKGNGDVVYVKSEYLTETKPEKKEETKAEETKTEEKKQETKTADTSAADAAKAAQDAANQAAAAAATQAAAEQAATQAAAEQAAQAAAAAAATQAAAAPVVSAGKYKNYDFTESQIANDWNSHGYSQTIGKSWNQLSEGEKADVANHYSHYGAAGW